MTGEAEQRGSLAGAVADALADDGPIARIHPGFTGRAGQVELARAIAEAIDAGGQLVAEAGTGTGKTFAYLVPALLAGARVLISTGTRNLQDQLFGRDLPGVIAALGVRAEVALLKGRSNYVCLHHLRRNLAEGRLARREDASALRRIERFAAVTDSGDRAALPGVPEDAAAWAYATSTRENCLGQDCAEFERCFVFKARQAAQRAEVVVVNHHLFCADLALRDEGIADLLPTTDALIFDEAHQLPDIATQFFGRSVSSRKLGDFARDCLRAGLAEAADAADWVALSRSIEQSVRELRLAAGAPGRIDAAAAATRPALLDAIEACAGTVDAARKVLDEAAQRGRELQRLGLRADELIALIGQWLAAVDPARAAAAGAGATVDASADASTDAAHAAGGTARTAHPEAGADPKAGADAKAVTDRQAVTDREAVAGPAADPAADPAAEAAPAAGPGDESGAVVIWAEVHGSGVSLNATPLSVADTFRRQLDAHRRAWIFLSATLAVGGSFEHFASAVGVGDDARRLVWESPFDFASNALLYVPQDIGEPSGPDFPGRVFRAIWPLLEANRGRAFVLCTTLRMVEQVSALIRDAIVERAPEIGLLVQGSASRAELLERFRRHPAPVLVGSASFWEGVDVPGRQLSLVVIDKLPFAPPDEPVLRARIDAARRAGRDPFRTMQLPAAAMALKQGAGRLIRSERDRGLLVVCDARLAERGYGRTLLRSLPPFRRTRSLPEAIAFVEAADVPVAGG